MTLNWGRVGPWKSGRAARPLWGDLTMDALRPARYSARQHDHHLRCRATAGGPRDARPPWPWSRRSSVRTSSVATNARAIRTAHQHRPWMSCAASSLSPRPSLGVVLGLWGATRGSRRRGRAKELREARARASCFAPPGAARWPSLPDQSADKEQTTAAAGRRRPQSRALRRLSIFSRTVLRFLCLRSYASTVLSSTSDKLRSRELISRTPRSS